MFITLYRTPLFMNACNMFITLYSTSLFMNACIFEVTNHDKHMEYIYIFHIHASVTSRKTADIGKHIIISNFY